MPAASLAEPGKFAYASYLVELADRFTAEAQPAPEIYALLSQGLEGLRQGPATAGFLRAFELHLLHGAGDEPRIDACGTCHRSVADGGEFFFDPVEGMLRCPGCRAPGAVAGPFSMQTLAALQALKGLTLAEARERRWSGTNAAEAGQLMGYLLAQHLASPLRSVGLIAALSGREASR